MRKNKGARVRLPDAEVKSPVNAGLVPGTNVNGKQCPDNATVTTYTVFPVFTSRWKGRVYPGIL